VNVLPATEPVLEKVPVAVVPVAFVVSVSTCGVAIDEFVIVSVGALVEVGTALTVPIEDSVVAFVDRLNTFAPKVIVAVWLAPGAPVNVPVWLAATGALAVRV
jgi:hypothetical protein